MKILCVIDCLGSGGAQRQMVNLVKGLKHAGYNVHLSYYFPLEFFLKEIADENIPIYFIKKKNRIGWNVIRGLKKVIKDEKFDIILSFLDTPNLYAVIAKKLSGVKSISITSERSTTDFSKNRFRLFTKKWAHKNADCIVFNSYHERDNWMQHFPIIKNKCITIYNGLDLDRFHPGTQTPVRKRKLISVGRVGPDKNGLCIIEALALINDTIKIYYTWIGAIVLSIASGKNYYEKMLQAIKDKNLQNVWHWKKPTTDLTTELHNNDALILSSVIEGLPNVVCEALACGIPVLISNILDHAVLVEDGVRGFLFDPHNPETLSDAIAKFYAVSDDEYAAMCRNARGFAEKNLSIDRMVQAYHDLFHDKTNGELSFNKNAIS